MNKQSVFVLGHKGMLGHVVTRYLKERGFEVFVSNVRFSPGPNPKLIESVQKSKATFVVNCIGRILQKSEDPTDMYLMNTVFPLQLAKCIRHDQKLVHISTDCVFSGKKGETYTELDTPDPIDCYGSSKYLAEAIAENPNVIVLRTSIVGPELETAFGLMAWFTKTSQSSVMGFTNHLWNGVTTLQLAKFIETLMTSSGNVPLTHYGSPNAVTKRELLELFRYTWKISTQITPVETKIAINRTLEVSLTLQIPSIREQLFELKEWY